MLGPKQVGTKGGEDPSPNLYLCAVGPGPLLKIKELEAIREVSEMPPLREDSTPMPL